MKMQFSNDNLQQIIKQIFQYDGLLSFLVSKFCENKVPNLGSKIIHTLNDDELEQVLWIQLAHSKWKLYYDLDCPIIDRLYSSNCNGNLFAFLDYLVNILADLSCLEDLRLDILVTNLFFFVSKINSCLA
jgi:hypothetical protein